MSNLPIRKPNQSLEEYALEIASFIHRGDKRKYTGEDYIIHPIAVHDLLLGPNFTENERCAAYLHDTAEDHPDLITIEDIRILFNDEIAEMVDTVTNKTTKTDGNRNTRKEIYNVQLKKGSIGSKHVKLADIYDNTKDVILHDPEFAKIYLAEKERSVEFALSVPGVDEFLLDKVNSSLLSLKTELFEMDFGMDHTGD